MKKILLTLIVMLGIGLSAQAQDYSTGIGFRGGLANGVTIKHFIGNTTALEGILLTRWSGFSVTGLYELHKQDAFGVDRLNWYYGAGAHLGLYDGANTTWGDNQNYVIIGIDGILGIEYNFEEIPINISVDWKPALNLIGYSGFWADGGALSIRYIF